LWQLLLAENKIIIKQWIDATIVICLFPGTVAGLQHNPEICAL
jgi:hypothetical protein